MTWLILAYRLPSDRSTGRVHVWRRLKRIGAQYLQDGLAILPANDRCREHFQWLAAEVVELLGQAHVIEGSFLSPESESMAVELFRDQARTQYGEVTAKMAEVRSLSTEEADQQDILGELLRQAWRLYAAARQIDWFQVDEGYSLHRELAALTREMNGT